MTNTPLKSIAVASLVALIGLTSTTVLAEDSQKTEESKNSIFAGLIVNGPPVTFDTLLDYKQTNGTQLVTEVINSPWAENPTHKLSLGFKTPVVLDLLQLGGAFDETYNQDGFNTYTGGTLFLNVIPTKEWTLRTGYVENMEGIKGTFVGGKYKNNFLTVDSDLWTEGDGVVKSHGFVSGVTSIFGKELYLSIGGEVQNKETGDNLTKINTLYGWLDNDGGWGSYSASQHNLETKSHEGKMIFVPRGFTRGRDFLDFNNHVYNGTEMRNVTTGYTLDGWAPFDAHAADGEKGHWTFVGKWHKNKEFDGGSVSAYYQPDPSLFLGVGGGYDYDKENQTNQKHHPQLNLEVYAKIPNTPLEMYYGMKQDLGKTAKVELTGVLAASGKF